MGEWMADNAQPNLALDRLDLCLYANTEGAILFVKNTYNILQIMILPPTMSYQCDFIKKKKRNNTIK